MPGGRSQLALIAAALAALAAATPAAAQDTTPGVNDFGGFRNILPAGQGETVNATELAANQATGALPRSFTSQLPHYTDIVYDAQTLTTAELGRFFKDAGFGVAPGDVESEISPRPGVKILRDREFQVPHVYGVTRSDVMFGAGYASAQDRLFFMDVLRHSGRGRLSELIGAGTNDANVKADAATLMLADYTEEELQQMIERPLRQAGAEGERALQDAQDFADGVNQYISEALNDQSKLPAEYPALGQLPEPWTIRDAVAVAINVGAVFSPGGGSEHRVAEVLRAAQERFGSRRGQSVFKDFRSREDPEAPTTLSRRFRFDARGRSSSRVRAIPELGSVVPRNPVVSGSKVTPTDIETVGHATRGALSLGEALHARQGGSNAVLVSRDRTESGRPLAIFGPQVGYWSPQVLLEIDLHGGGVDARGAAFPGISQYVLLGRGPDFAWSATTANVDHRDIFASPLCNPDGSEPTLDSRHYTWRGECRAIETRDHTLNIPAIPSSRTAPRTIEMKVERTVYGPVQGRAVARGVPVVLSLARSTYMHEVDSTLTFARLNSGEVKDARSFIDAFSLTNFSFNWHYADDRDIAYFNSGAYPVRPRGAHPDMPIWGDGTRDWPGFDPKAYTMRTLPASRHPQAINPREDYIVQWNNKQAPGWRAADSMWAFGSVARSQRLEKRLLRKLRAGKIDAADITQVAQLAATVDIRAQELWPWLRKMIGNPGDTEIGELRALLDAWSRSGGHRRDLDRDNVLEHSAAVLLMDAWWPKLVEGMFQPVLGESLMNRIRGMQDIGTPPGPGGSAFFGGWWGHVDKDIRRLLGRRVRQPLSRRYCGRGSRARCREILVSTLREAAAEVEAAQGTADRSAWARPATCPRTGSAQPRACDQIEFTTAGAVATRSIPWQDRPTFQQLVEVQGHRPR